MELTITQFKSKRWISFFAALFIIICSGFGYAWSVFQIPFVEKYGWDAGDVSLTFTVTIVLSTIAPLFFGRTIQKFKINRVVLLGGILIGTGLFCTSLINSVFSLYITYGVLGGIGVGLVYPTLMSYSVKLFPDKKGLAAGCMAAGYGSGAIIWAPLASSIIEKISLGASFKVLGSLFFVVIILASFFLIQIPEGFTQKMQEEVAERKNQNSKIGQVVEDKSRGQMAKTLNFYLMLFIFTFGTTSGLMIISQASPILQETLSYSPARAAAFVGFLSLFNTLGRLVWGGVSDKMGRFNVMLCLFALAGLSMIGLAFFDAPAIVVVAMALVESCYGAFSSIITPCTSDMFGTKYLTENYGLMYIIFGFASILGPRIAVISKNMNGGSYINGYLIALLFSCLGLALTFCLQKRNARRKVSVE